MNSQIDPMTPSSFEGGYVHMALIECVCGRYSECIECHGEGLKPCNGDAEMDRQWGWGYCKLEGVSVPTGELRRK